MILMRMGFQFSVRVILVKVTAFAFGVAGGDELKLTYQHPAGEWAEALPIGNGRLGAMVYGGPSLERLQLAEETLWTGPPRSYNNPDAFGHLAATRRLLRDGDFEKAEEEASKMMGRPLYQAAYQPLGDLFLAFPNGQKSEDYRRELNLTTGETLVSFQVGENRFERTIFASRPDDAIVVHLDCEKSGQLTFDLSLTSPHPFETRVLGEGSFLMEGQVAARKENLEEGARKLIANWDEPGTKFAAQVKVMSEGGTVAVLDNKVSVRNANVVTLIISGATSFVNFQDVSGDPVAKLKDIFAVLEGKSFQQLQEAASGGLSGSFLAHLLLAGGRRVGGENRP